METFLDATVKDGADSFAIPGYSLAAAEIDLKQTAREESLFTAWTLSPYFTTAL